MIRSMMTKLNYIYTTGYYLHWYNAYKILILERLMRWCRIQYNINSHEISLVSV